MNIGIFKIHCYTMFYTPRSTLIHTKSVRKTDACLCGLMKHLSPHGFGHRAGRTDPHLVQRGFTTSLNTPVCRVKAA